MRNTQRGLHIGARMTSLDPNILLYIYSDYTMYMRVTYILQEHRDRISERKEKKRKVW